MTGKTIGYALCGSFCTIEKALQQMESLKLGGAEIVPILSQTVFETDTRFFQSNEIKARVHNITANPILHTVREAEPIGPKKLLDLLVIAPCTGNTLAKLANGITDTAVTMAAKAHLRNGRPVLLAVSTNDGLSGSAANLGALLARRHFYFVPFGQDSAFKKPRSLVADFTKLPETVDAALRGEQLQPMLYTPGVPD